MDTTTTIRIICGIGAVILLLILIYRVRKRKSQL